MLSSSRIVFSEDIGGVLPWQPRQFGQPEAGPAPQGTQPEAAAEPTYQDGLREGLTQGLAQAQAEFEAQRQRDQEEAARTLTAVVASATQTLGQVQQVFADRVARLALEIARNATGLAIDLDMNLIGPAIQKALAALTDEGLKPTLHLHPTDIERFGPALEPLLALHQASLLADPGVERGGCLVNTPAGRIDATVAARWQETVAELGLHDPWVRAG